MLDRLRKIIEPSPAARGQHTPMDMQVAAAVMLVEVAHVDNEYSASEQEAIRAIVKQRFSLTDAEVEDLVKEAEQEVKDATDYYRFTRRIKETFSHEECVNLVQLLWEVVLADGSTDAYENNLMGRVTDLLYVTSRESAEARKRAAQTIKAAR